MGNFALGVSRIQAIGLCPMDAAADYNFEVARGWESKQIEDQQAEAGRSSVKSGQPMTPNDAARQRAKESLRLSRQRVLQQLEASTNPRHRELLELELNALEEKLRNLNQ